MLFIRTRFFTVSLLSLFGILAFSPNWSDAGPGNIGKISGYKFNDLNGNGRDDREPGLPGFTILLNNLGPFPVSLSTVTNRNGDFFFDDLPLQAYRVCEIAPVAIPPWVSTTPSCVNVTLSSHFPFSEVVFGNQQEVLGQISGYKFNDLNGSGVDNGEPRLPGFTIFLNNVGSIPVSMSTVTDSNGAFSFNNLPLQEYQICEIAPVVTPPWIPTTPSCVNVILSRSTPSSQVVFGNQQREQSVGCTRTQGYWGNSPAGRALLQTLVPGTLALGTTNYTSAQLLSILDTPPAGGNALLILSHQLIAAKLNILNGASSTPVASTITAADSAIGTLVIPPVGSGFVASSSTLGQTMIALAATLDSYNNGNLGVPHCP